MKYDFEVDTEISNHSHVALLNSLNPGDRVLELGCATGYLSRILTEKLHCHVVGVELDKQAAEKARKICARVIVADLDHDELSGSLQGENFDVILCADVLEHLRDPVSVLSGLKPYLKADGRLLASVPNIAHASIRLELMQGHFDYEKLGLLDDTHLHFYTRDGLVNMLSAAGYASYDINYTVQDLADEAIQEHLGHVGLQATDKTLLMLRQPDALAYQFIIAARPAAEDVLRHRVPALQPKPVASSDTYYSQKQQRIVNLEHQVQQLQAHVAAVDGQRDDLQQHQRNMQQQIEEMTEHIKEHQQNIKEHQQHIKNLNAAHEQHLQAKDEELFRTHFALAEQQTEAARAKQRMQVENEQLNLQLQTVNKDRDRLEQVLRRVHSKLSYRGLQFVRRIIKGARHTRRMFAYKEKPELIVENNWHNYALWSETYDTLTDKDVSIMREQAKNRQPGVKLAVLMPVYNTLQPHLEQAIESVLAQAYTHWELCIVDDHSTLPHVKKVIKHYAQRDARIKTLFRDSNGHISKASNSGLELVDAAYVALMDHDDILTPDALFWVADALHRNPEVKLIYSDEDKLDARGQRFAPYFKPDWNPELFYAHNFLCHLGVYKTQLLRKLGGFKTEFDGAQDYDLALRYIECINSKEIIHIPRILYHWRAIPGSTANGVEEKPYAENAIQRAAMQSLQRRDIQAEAIPHERLPGALRIRYCLPVERPLVSIIIPTRNGFALLKRCVESILAKTSYPNYEILLIDNGSDDKTVLRFMQHLKDKQGIRIIRDARPFNYAALNNSAVKQAKGSLIALLNNDLEVISEGWLEEMVSFALQPEYGAVGAKLYYPDDKIQHAGVIIGLGGVAGHAHKHFPKQHAGVCGRLLLTQNLSAVTAACMVLRKTVFEEVGGFNEEHLSVAFNDVDLCLKIREQGYFNVWTPYAELYHHESATRGNEDTDAKQIRFAKEIAYMKARWGKAMLYDPAYNPNLTLDREDFSFAWPPRINQFSSNNDEYG